MSLSLSRIRLFPSENIVLKYCREVSDYFRKVSAYAREVSAYFLEETSFKNLRNKFREILGHYGNQGFRMILRFDTKINDCNQCVHDPNY